MNKSKIVLVASCVFSLVFLGYIFKMSRDLSRLEDILVESPNVVDVTDKIQTKILVTPENIQGSRWASPSYNDISWKTVDIPKHRIVSEKEFKENNFAYYRIHIPKSAFSQLFKLKNEISISLQYVQFSKMDIYLNGMFFRSSTPVKSVDFITNLPLNDEVDNVISIKGYIKTGDFGINHRGRILVGKGVELNDLYSKSYKSMTVRGLIYLLCKGSILFIFTLLFLVLKVDRFFEKSLLYAMFVVLEDILTGDYVYGLLNLNQQVYLYDIVDLGINTFLFLFLADVLQIKLKNKTILLLISVIGFASLIISIDLLHTSLIFNIDHFIKFWNLVFVCNLIFFLPRLYNKEKVFFVISTVAVAMAIWSGLFSSNVGLNLKAFGNLLIFFGVAYQTFILFRRQQIQLFEQEKDAAIGKTAAILAHDARRPLLQMSMMLDKISNGDSTEEFLRVAKQDIEFSLISVDSHINDIINFSKNKKHISKEVSFYKTLASSIKQVLSINTNSSLTLSYDFKAESKILGDESGLASILSNLISNAVEAIFEIGNEKSGSISFLTYTENGRFIFNISNTGPNIPNEILSDIFEPLFTSGKVGGTGLGLASVRKILKDFEGDVEVYNIPTRGVMFILKFKLAGSHDNAETFQFYTDSKQYRYHDISEFSLPEKSNGLRIFIYDENIKSYEHLSLKTKGLPFQVEIFHASSLNQAKKLISSKYYDIIIIDSDYLEAEIINFFSSVFLFSRNQTLYTSCEILTTNTRFKSLKRVTELSENDLLDMLLDATPKRLKILLVEDSKIITMGWLMYYGKSAIHCVSNPDDAIKYLQTKPEVDICVLDYHYEGYEMNGVALGELIQRDFFLNRILISSSADINTTKFKIIPKGSYRLED